MRAWGRAVATGFFLAVTLMLTMQIGCDRPRSLTVPSPGAAPRASASRSVELRVTVSRSEPLATPLAHATAARATQPVPTPSPEFTLRERLVARARYYAGTETHYRLGSTGPTFFDCTGLVYRVFADCAALEFIGAQGEQDVRGYLDWFSARRQADLMPPGLADLIVYGAACEHIGIYVGAGRVISTLTAGVREHAVELRDGPGGPVMPVQAYLHLKAE